MGPGVLQGKVPPGGRLRLSPPTCLPSATRSGHSPPPQALPLPSCLCGDVPTPGPTLYSRGLYSRGPWLNTPPSCFLQSLRLCHPKTDTQTSSCAVSPVPPHMLSPGLPTADLGSLGTAPACLEFTSLGLTRLQGLPSTRRTKPAQRGSLEAPGAEQTFPGARGLGGRSGRKMVRGEPLQACGRDPSAQRGRGRGQAGVPRARTPSPR